MSLIERAARKLNNTDEPSLGADVHISADEQARIAAAIAATEQSFGLDSEEHTSPKVIREDGPSTVMTRNVGLVDINTLRTMGVLTPDAGRTQLAEEYRLIKRPLLANAFGLGGVPRVEHGNVIMVTSSAPGEGKSFCAINLAISMAMELEHTVLLVDADMTKSAVVRYLGLRADRGLIDVLRDPQISLPDVLIKTSINKLTVLPAGKNIGAATELLASSAMRSFVEDIASRYPDRIIIFDCPPILATSEATVLARYMGQIVFVVEASRTPREAVREALSQLQSCEHIGILLNKVPERGGSGGYGYGYGYGYGSYGGYGEGAEGEAEKP